DEYAAWFPVDTACDHRRPLGSAARSMPPNRSTVPPAPSRPGNARDGFACAYRRTRNRKSSSDSWDGGLVEGSWTEGYFSTGQTACGDLIGESFPLPISAGAVQCAALYAGYCSKEYLP